MHVYTMWGEFVISWWWLTLPLGMTAAYAVFYWRELRRRDRASLHEHLE